MWGADPLKRVTLKNKSAFLPVFTRIYKNCKNLKICLGDIFYYKSIVEFVNNNRRQKDILTKTTITDIKRNYYRIGFKLYQNKITEDIRNINDIVIENTRLIEKLSNLNSRIEVEINKLIKYG